MLRTDKYRYRRQTTTVSGEGLDDPIQPKRIINHKSRHHTSVSDVYNNKKKKIKSSILIKLKSHLHVIKIAN
jgi:hypothetical protein